MVDPVEPEALLVLLHGVGSTPDSLAPLARQVGQRWPRLAVHVPEGIAAFDGGPGRQWFSIAGVTEANRPARIAAALPALRAMIAAQLAQVGLPPDRLILGGFSQGAIMALSLAGAGDTLAGVVSMAGRLALPPAATPPLATPCWLIHGAQDQVIAPRWAQLAADWLTAAGAAASLQMLPHTSHAIDAPMASAVLAAVGEVMDTRIRPMVPAMAEQG